MREGLADDAADDVPDRWALAGLCGPAGLDECSLIPGMAPGSRRWHYAAMKKLVFCLLAALPTVALIIAAIYVVSYASVPPMPIAYEGGSITTYDAEIGF